MKKPNFVIKVILLLALIFSCFTFAFACGGNTENNEPSNPQIINPDPADPTDDPTDPTDPTDDPADPTDPTDDPTDPTDPTEDETEKENRERIASCKSEAKAKLDEIVVPALTAVTDETVKSEIRVFYETEKQYIEEIKDLENALILTSRVIQKSDTFVADTLKPLVISKINDSVNPIIQNIEYEELRTSVQAFYDSEIAKVNAVTTFKEVADLLKEATSDILQFVKDESEKILTGLKDEAIEQLNTFVTALIAKIPYDGLKGKVQTFYNEEQSKLSSVKEIEGISPCIIEIKNDLETFVLSETKSVAIDKLNDVVENALNKIPVKDLREDLNAFYSEEADKISAITKIEDIDKTTKEILGDTEDYAKTLLSNLLKTCIETVAPIENVSAYSYLPESMRPDYSGNVVKASDIEYDFTSFTNVSEISKVGFGEQWQMVISNVNQSILMGKAFGVVKSALTTAANAMNLYYEKTDGFSDKTFGGENFTAVFDYNDSGLCLEVKMEKTVNVPVLGAFSPTVKMVNDAKNNSKEMYIDLGDVYKVKYVVSDDRYEMTAAYGISVKGVSATRSSYLAINREKTGKTVGHIYEYTTLKTADVIKACADFYVENGYVSVVGNKASDMVFFDGYINELYSEADGKLLGYEVREEKTIAGFNATYNTLWFNIWDIAGITSVKVLEKSKDNKSSRSTADVYVNGSETLFVPTYNTKFKIKTSRKYDVELRSRFYYTYDAENDKYVANEVMIPMMFIQEGDNFNAFNEDVLKDNGLALSVSLNSQYLAKIMGDYDTLIDVFIQNKELITSQDIKSYLA